MFARTFTLFAIAACVSALQPRLLNDIIANGPTGNDGQTFQSSLDSGASWQENNGSLRFPAQSTVGFRVANTENSTVTLKNTIAAGSSSETVVTVTEDGGSYGLEVGDTNTYIFTDYTKSPEQPITPGEWVPIRVSAGLDESNGGGCKVPHLNATIFYRDGSTPLTVASVVNERGHHTVRYTIDDLFKVQNITFSFGKKKRPVIVPESQSPYLAQYTSAENAPLVTAFMYILGDFCDNSQG